MRASSVRSPTNSFALDARPSTWSAQGRASGRASTPSKRSLPSSSNVARSYLHEARKRVGPKRARIRPIIERIAAAHPDATIALRSRSDHELLITVMLMAQTCDVNVKRMTERLFVKYRLLEDYIAVPLKEFFYDIVAT